jgi:selenide,water dikinase
VPSGTLENLAHVSPHVDFAPGLSRVDKVLLADAQTSGGLLVSVPAGRSEALLAALREKGVLDARRIGRFTGPGTGRIRVG